MSGSVEAVPPTAPRNRSIEARLAACVSKASREEPTDLLSCGASVAAIAAREAMTTKPRRPEMAPQELEKTKSAPGFGMAAQASNPQDLVQEQPLSRISRVVA